MVISILAAEHLSGLSLHRDTWMRFSHAHSDHPLAVVADLMQDEASKAPAQWKEWLFLLKCSQSGWWTLPLQEIKGALKPQTLWGLVVIIVQKLNLWCWCGKTTRRSVNGAKGRWGGGTNFLRQSETCCNSIHLRSFTAVHQFLWSCSWISDEGTCCKLGAPVPWWNTLPFTRHGGLLNTKRIRQTTKETHFHGILRPKVSLGHPWCTLQESSVNPKGSNIAGRAPINGLASLKFLIKLY